MTDVSFVVTIFNKSEFIPFVVNAIFSQQNIGECEYIFVDDGSTDDSLAVLQKCTRGHTNVKIITQENVGPALATNRGIAEVTSPYIKFVDGDDILHPLSTFELLKAISELDLEFAYSLGEEVPLESYKMRAPNEPIPDTAPQLIDNPMDIIIKKGMCNLTCVLASTQAVLDMGGCDPRVFIQDYSFVLRMAARTKFALVPKILNWCPISMDNRASALSGGAQVLHDLNAALAFFVSDHHSLDSKIKTRMLQRAAGRAWKWSKREEGQSFLSKYMFQYMLARVFPSAGCTSERIAATCEAFRLKGTVRIPTKRSITNSNFTRI